MHTFHFKNNCIYFVPETPAYMLSFASQPEMKAFIVAGTDDIIKENGHDALHLPQYHPDFSPIELVWGDIKNRVAQECMSTNLKVMEMFCKKVFAEYTKEKWQNCCHT
jgi:hypothetical protein